MQGPEITQLSDETMWAMEPQSMAGLIRSPLFAELDGTILITGFSGEEEMLNSYDGTGVHSAIDTVANLLRTLFNVAEVSQLLRDDSEKTPSPTIRIEYAKSLHDESGNLIFDSPDYRLPTVWIHRGHGGYDENRQIGISASKDSEPMVLTQTISKAISSRKGAMLLAVLPLCVSAPSADILRNNPNIIMVEGNDNTDISDCQAEDRLRSLVQIRSIMRLRGWVPKLLQNLIV